MNGYFKAALDRCCIWIVAAPNGAREWALREKYSIGGPIPASALDTSEAAERRLVDGTDQ
jgi:hypothetical protein